MDNEMTTRKATEIATDAPMDFFGDRTGFENLDPACIQIPFLKLAKDGTDEVKKMSPVYIPGLEPGMFFCPTTKKIYGDNINLVILNFRRTYVIYEGVGKESKYQGSITPMEYDRDILPHAVREKSYTLYNGLRYVDTRSFMVAPYDSLEDGRMIFSLSSSGIKPSVSLLTQATNVRVPRNGKVEIAPMWTSVWNLGVRFFNDPKGDYFQVAGVNRVGWVAKGEVATQLKKWFDESEKSAINFVEEEAAPRNEAPKYTKENPGRSAADMARRAGGESEYEDSAAPADVF